MQAISFDQWKSDIVQGIESSAHTTEKGDRFVQVILRDRYQLSEDDAANATDTELLACKQVDIRPHSQGQAHVQASPKAKPTTEADAPQLWDVEQG